MSISYPVPVVNHRQRPPLLCSHLAADHEGMAFRLLILRSIVAVALVLLSFKKAHTGTDRLKQLVAPAHVTPAQFRRVTVGMKVARVRKLLGPPNESARAGGQVCWDYGTQLSKGGM
jgi:outer membrane protein assembly factor BamE (lipoprotein component of BamABCDE complex)